MKTVLQFNRREVLRWVPASALAWLGMRGASRGAQPAQESPAALPLLPWPPVVQHLGPEGFAVSVALGRLATAWIEWGTTPDALDHKAIPSRAGLVGASDRALIVPVALGADDGPSHRIYYRVVAQPLSYETAYKLHRGEPVAGPTFSLTLPDLLAPSVRVAVVNDTHEKPKTLAALVDRIEAIQPGILFWNGDTCAAAFNKPADPPRVLLKPAWAATRSLVFVPCNHDFRGACAREVLDCLAAGPEPGLPYNVAVRRGPLALLTLDTGEDKPDAHPVFAGTAAYEPYRVRQAAWLRKVLVRSDIASAPFKVAFCHIPLRGLPGEKDGLSLEGFAAWSGDGARNWMPELRKAGVHLLVSGHQHAWRIDEPADGLPMQVVGGGSDLVPDKRTATVIVLEADAQALRVMIQEGASGKELARRQIPRA